MEFLLNVEVNFTPDVTPERRADLVKQEHAHATDLRAKGHLVRIWRAPCRLSNWAIWQAKDATQLHELVSGLPLYPWLRVTVHPLAEHPIETAVNETKAS